MLISGWAKRFRRGNDEIAESRQLGAAADGRAVHHADDGLADFQHSREGRVKRVEHLKHALRGVFADVDAAREDFAGGVQDDQLDFIALAGVQDSPGDFAEHGFIEKIVFRTVEVILATPASMRNFTCSNWSGVRRSGCEVKSWVLTGSIISRAPALPWHFWLEKIVESSQTRC